MKTSKGKLVHIFRCDLEGKPEITLKVTEIDKAIWVNPTTALGDKNMILKYPADITEYLKHKKEHPVIH